MPWEVKFGAGKCGGSKPWGVVKKDTGALVACHESEAKARGHMRALYANEPRAQGHLVAGGGSYAVVAADQIDGENRQWIEVMPEVDSAENGGKKFVVTRADLEVYADSIRANGGNTVVDYDHEGDSENGSTRASGWFTGQADVRDTDRGPILYAEVQWTPIAAQAIRDGEYRFISPVFTFHDRDAKTGVLTRAKDLIAATLTNRPFFKALSPVVAAEAPTTEGEEMSLLDKLRQRLGLPEDATEDDVLAKFETPEPPAPEPTDPKPEAETAEVAEPVAAAASTEPEGEASVNLLEHANEQLAKRVEDLEAKLAARENQETTTRRDNLVAAALTSGQIRPDEHDLYRANLDINEGATAKVLASLPKGRVPVAERGAAPPASQAATDLGWFPQFNTQTAKEAVNHG